jgi:hypothetical protein
MARASHIVASLLLFVAFGLMLVTSISAPVVGKLGILKVVNIDKGGTTTIQFGTFGYCTTSPTG